MVQNNFAYNLDIRNPPRFISSDHSSLAIETSPIVDLFSPGFKYNFLLSVFSYLNGSDLLHSVSRLSKKFRQEIPTSGLLDQ